MMALLGTVALSTAASTEDVMQEKEKAAWQAFKDKKPDDFKKVVSPNLVAVYAEGMSDLQKELADMQKWDMKSFAISDYKVTSDGSDTVVTTYNGDDRRRIRWEGPNRYLQRRLRLEETEGKG